MKLFNKLKFLLILTLLTTMFNCSGKLFSRFIEEYKNDSSDSTGTPPRLSSITVVNNTKITVTFTKNVEQTSAETTTNYSVTKLTALQDITVSTATRSGANLAQVTITFNGSFGVPGMVAGTYQLTVANVTDTSATAIEQNGLDNVRTFTGDALPQLISATAPDKLHIQLTFSEAMEQISVENIANYITALSGLGNSLTISSASQDAVNKALITLTHNENQTFGVNNYNVKVSAVVDLKGNPLLLTGNNADFSGTSTSDTTPPEIQSAASISSTTAIITFSEGMKSGAYGCAINNWVAECSGTTQCATIYTITEGAISASQCPVGAPLAVNSATVIPNTAKVRIITNNPPLGQLDTTYCITVNVTNNCASQHYVGDVTGNILSQGTTCSTAGITRKCNVIAFQGDARPKVLSASAIDSTHVELTFSDSLMSDAEAISAECTLPDCSAAKKENYCIGTMTSGTACTGTSLSIIAASLKGSASPDNKKVILTTAVQTVSEGYTVIVADGSAGNLINDPKGVTDLTKNPVLNDATNDRATFTGVATADTTPPYLVSAAAQGNTSVLLTFSESVTSSTSQLITNYSIIPTLNVTSSTPSVNTAQVLLTTTSHAEQTYAITVSGITDQAANAIGSPNTAAFTGDALPTVLGVTSRGCTATRITFSEDMNKTSTENSAATDYTFSSGTPAVTINSASRDDINKNIVDLSTSAQGLSQIYNVTVSNGVGDVKDLTGNSMGSPNARSITVIPIEANSPYVLTAASIDNTHARITFSEPMAEGSCSTSSYSVSGTGACAIANYTFSVDSGSCGTFIGSPTGGIKKISTTTFELVTPDQCDADKLLSINTSSTTDVACNLITNPKFASFNGTAPTDTTKPKLLFSVATSLKTIEATFSEPMASSTTNIAGNWSVVGCTTLTVSSSTVPVLQAAPNDNKVVITTVEDQEGCNYLVTASSSTITDQAAAPNVVDSDFNSVSFTGSGNPITGPEDGPQFEDPFGDGTKSGFSFVYGGKVYIGPNESNSSAVRFEANGSNLINVSFDAGTSYTSSTRFDFGHPTNDIDGGPTGVDGVGAFIPVLLGSTGILVAGTTQINATINNIFITKDTDTKLDYTTCAVSAPSGIRASTAVGASGNNILIGFSSNASAQRPNLNRLPVAAGTANCSGNNFPAAFARNIPGVGSNNGNPRSNGGVIIGIDQIFNFTRDQSYIVIANNGGFAIAAVNTGLDKPDSSTDFTDVHPTAWNRISPSLISTRVYSKLTTLQPWERSISGIANFGTNNLYVGRNRCKLPADDDNATCRTTITGDTTNASNSISSISPDTGDVLVGMAVSGSGISQGTTVSSVGASITLNQNATATATGVTLTLTTPSSTGETVTPELWKGTCVSSCTNAGNWTWTKVFDAADFASWGTRIDAISAVIVNGSRLYVAMDSDVAPGGANDDGVHLVYTTNTNPTAASDFTELGRATPATQCTPLNIDNRAFGKYCNGKRVFSAASIQQSSNYYLYLSVGDNINSLRVFRQID